jgi:hypothetical protein
MSATVCLFLTTACAPQSSNQTEHRIQPVSSVLELHDAMINPASDAIFNAGVEAPADEAAWTTIRKNAVVLAESGNLLMMPRRARDEGRWMELSWALVEGGKAAMKAAEARKTDELLAASDQIVETCMACHEPYRDGRKIGAPPAK